MAIKRMKIPKAHFYSKKNEIYEGDLVWFTIGSSSRICIVLKVKSKTQYVLFSNGEIIKVNNWRIEKIE